MKRHNNISFGPMQEDGTCLVANYGDETHDLLIDPDGEIVSENIWGGEYQENICDCHGPGYGLYTRESRYINVCDECGQKSYDTHHCLILDREYCRVYEGNPHKSFFWWERIELEAWL